MDPSLQFLAGQVEGLWILAQQMRAQDRRSLLTRAEHQDIFQKFIPQKLAGQNDPTLVYP